MTKVKVLATRSCPSVCNPMDYSQPSSSVHVHSPGKNTRVGCHSLLQGIFLTPGSNMGLLHCRQMIYHLSHLGSLKTLPNPFTEVRGEGTKGLY